MAKLRWTEQAADDLEAIADYIAQDCPHYASLFCLNIIAKIERLELFPTLGRVVPEMNDPRRVSSIPTGLLCRNKIVLGG